MRLFVAVDPGDRLRAELTPALDACRARWDLRWVRPENLHVTLRFLGETPSETLPEVEEALLEAVWKRRGFTLTPGGLDVLPAWRRPRVLFLQMTGDGALEETAAAVARSLEMIDPVPAREAPPFRSHLTLARFRRDQSPEVLAELREAVAPVCSPAPIADVRLIESRLGPDGPTYRTLRTFPLATPLGT